MKRNENYSPIPFHQFRAFHQEFHGDTWDICTRCGGKCEINKIGSLMPGEAEYIASDLGVSIDAFRDDYLDGIVTPFGVIDVLKLKPGCPFLSADFRCTIPHVKVVLCDVYPIVFEVQDDRVEFSLDPWCPIVRYVPELAKEFETKGIPAIQRLHVPLNWYRAVELYDGLCVDYHKLFGLRATNMNYVCLTIEQVQACQADDAPPPDLTSTTNLIYPTSLQS